MRLVLRAENSWTRVVDGDEDAVDWLRKFLSFRDSKAELTQRITRGKAGEVWVSAVSRRRFGTGLLGTVVRAAGDAGVELVIDDRRAATPDAGCPDLTGAPLTLYPDQQASIASWWAGGLRGIVKSPTASGKGRLAVAAAHAVPGHTVFMVHRGNLVDDVQARWGELMAGIEPPAGRIARGAWRPGERLTCATLQSLHAKLGTPEMRELAARTTAVIVDECHVASARTYSRTVQMFVRAGWRLGLSATPLDRTDKRTIIGLGTVGPVVHENLATDLASKGRILLPEVFVVPILERASQADAPWAWTYQELVVDSDHRNGAVLKVMELERERGDLPGMVFVRKKDHGRFLRDAARKRGMNVDFVCGEDDLGRRQRAIRDLERGRLDWVVATQVFTEGVNIPELRTMVNAAAGESVIDALQRAGRVMRVAPGKPRPRIWEFGDKGHPALHRHAKNRLKAYKTEGYDRTVVRDVWPERS